MFDPRDEARWGRVLDPDGDGVYNFTTITISAGSTLKVQGDKVNTAAYWLASGNVVIDGVLDSRGLGARAAAISAFGGKWPFPVPAAIQAARGSSDSSVAPTPGEGPGGGSGVVDCGEMRSLRVRGAPLPETGISFLWLADREERGHCGTLTTVGARAAGPS